jgi:hypothetical protein
MRFSVSLGLLTAAGLWTVPTASAGVISSGPVNITIPRDFTGLGLNVITGEASRNPSDFNVDINFFELNGEWRFAQLDWFSGGGIVSDGVDGPPALLQEGDIIGPGSPLREGGSINSEGLFDDVEGAYLGFLFENEATNTLHYGWVQFTLPSVGDGVITAYAYQSTPMTQIVVPSPAGIALAGVAGLFAIRRRR